MYFFKSLAVLPPMPPSLARLPDIAKNFWWSWEPGADALFHWLDAELWNALHHNPIAFLLSLPQERLDEASQNHEFLEIYREYLQQFDKYLEQSTWYDETFPAKNGKVIAYMSAEFGIHECLPIYSGGLGLLAGDHLKAASDLGIPLVAVGLLYKFGYFNQEVNPEGWQDARYPLLNFYKMPISLLTDQDGRELEVQVELSDNTGCRQVALRIWQASVGRVSLYLLDSDTPRNRVPDRQLTGRLYGGDHEMRLVQELLLGIGGVRALRAVGISPAVWHINEGHAAFSIIERLRELTCQGLDLETAREVIRASTVFTTHTPVPAGHDIFQPELLGSHLDRSLPQLGLDWRLILEPAYDHNRQGYNMTLLAHKHAAYTNAVSRLHQETTRRMLFSIYPGIPAHEIPVDTVTNGVHIETWLAPEWVERFNRLAGDNWRTPKNSPEAWEKIAKMSAAEIWGVRRELKAKMLDKCRASLLNQRLRYYASPSQLKEIETYLPPDALTLVFARRFATYKRANLLLQDRERLAKMITDPARPVQLIFAGKAHPADRAGQEIIKQIYDLSQQEPFKGRIAFIEDYDIAMARCMVQGADVWINTPRRPLEASGTSGQKAVLNGTVHLSVLDGWWPEAYDGQNGFAVGRGEVYSDEGLQDYYDSLALYAVLEDIVIPAYYERTHGVPRAWVDVIRNGWRSVPHFFCTGRMIKEYTSRFYVPLMERYNHVVQNNYAAAKHLRDFRQYITQNWPSVRIDSITVEKPALPVAGDVVGISALVHLGAIQPKDVVVEVVLGKAKDRMLLEPTGIPMVPAESQSDSNYLYEAKVSLTQGTLGFTVRVRPSHPDLVHPFEIPLVTWAPEF
ncbi:MAG: alpha-glucan family phosphorylase [Bacillota bacterium]